MCTTLYIYDVNSSAFCLLKYELHIILYSYNIEDHLTMFNSIKYNLLGHWCSDIPQMIIQFKI